MMRSMFSGVSGLKVHQTKMDVIGNNISNVNTVGYKAQRVTFNEVFSQTLQGASAANDDTGRGGINAMQVGLGVNVSSIDMLMTQGAAERTDNPFDLMINGDSFLVVGDASGQYFTRNGALRVDADGNLCIPNGMRVKGWMAQPKTGTNEYEIVKGEVQDITLAAAATSNPSITKKVKLSGNITSSLAAGDHEETSISFYDSLGNFFKANIEIEKQVATGGAVTYVPTVKQVTDSAGNTVVNSAGDAGFTLDAATIKFKSDGSLDTTGATTLTLKPSENDLTKLSLISPSNGIPTAYTGNIGDVTIDLSGLTQYTSKSTLTSKTSDGNAAGTMSGYGIGADGIITATYSNGDQRVVGQVVVAEFDNPAGLEKAGENLFTITSNSGEFDGIGKTGDFSTGCLEMSNVDLSTEFTQMITTQRGFQANSRIITVSDEMLQELTNLKR